MAMEAGPWISLGLKGANKIIDKHFERVPHKYLYSDTYKPKALKKRRDRKNSQDQNNSESEEEEEVVQERSLGPESDTEEVLRDKDVVLGRDMGPPMPRDGSLPGGAYSQESPYIQPPFPMYSHESPRARPQYMPEQAIPPIGVAGGYYPPPPSEHFVNSPYDNRRSRGRRDSWDDEDDYYSDSYRQPRRPKPVTRRSSSYHGPRGSGRGRDDSDSEDNRYAALVSKRGKTPSGSEHVDKARHTAHRYKVKDEIEGSFTKSKAGLGGAAVGAVVAGWAANKAQIGYTKDGGKKDPNSLVTLLGAAVGGLAVNALVEKYEESKRDTDDKQDKYNDKWGKDGDTKSEGGRSQKSQRRKGDKDRDYGSDGGRSQRSRRRRDSAYGSDGYD
ncbi:uncharacterized protein LY89DRAFT_776969 [Mollisia scopiformis]|uniref:Uncharacterized protein n=1 Tax=Mollisia scopiformis TaxID=149040 RepID=A0A194XSJ4_MOLSC|nr:uncharacterized protein LY89DRAFT_776969 [Mollisia scopiformis]KUJ23168.1 hypothetical protein LY89DRAFT_776969 [Mollisia scopiformis]